MSITDFGPPQPHRFGTNRHDVPSRVAGGGVPNGGAALDAPDVGERAHGSPPTLQVFPWWYYPAPGSQYFFVNARPNQVVPALTANQLLTGSDLTIANNERGVVVGVALIVQLPTAADDFFYTMLRNGAPVPGLDRLRNYAVAANAAVNNVAGYAVQLEPGDRISWTVTNDGAAAVTVGLNYLGWRTMQTEIERIQQGYNY